MEPRVGLTTHPCWPGPLCLSKGLPLTVRGHDAHNQSEHLANPRALTVTCVFLSDYAPLVVPCLDFAHPVGLCWAASICSGWQGEADLNVCVWEDCIC